MVVKINVSFPEEVLKDLDYVAHESHTSRSAFLVQAVKHYLEEKEREKLSKERHQAAKSIRKIAEQLGDWDGTEEILKWRNDH